RQGRFDTVDTFSEAQIAQYDIRMQSGCHDESLFSRRCLPEHSESPRLDDGAQPRSNDRLVIDQQHCCGHQSFLPGGACPTGSVAISVVPSPGAERTSRDPPKSRSRERMADNPYEVAGVVSGSAANPTPS